MLKKLVSIGMLLVMVFSVAACVSPKEQDIPKAADWNALYETARGWGYEESIDDFVSVLLSGKGERDDNGNVDLSAYEIYTGYNPLYISGEEQWISDLLQGSLVLSESEWNNIIDNTIYEFNKVNPNVGVSYIPHIKVSDPEVKIEIPSSEGPPTGLGSLYFDNNIAQVLGNHYYSLENGMFYKYSPKYIHTSPLDYTIEYEKIVLASIQDNTTLYEHVQEEKGLVFNGAFFNDFDVLFDIVLDTREKFEIYTLNEKTFRFKSTKNDGFSIWDGFDFSWDYNDYYSEIAIMFDLSWEYDECYIYSLSKLVCEATVENGKLSQIKFFSNDAKIQFWIVMDFTYGSVSLTLPEAQLING